MDPSPKIIELLHYPCQWNLELTGAATVLHFLHVVYVCKEVISIMFLFTKACESGYPISAICIFNAVTRYV